MFFAKSFHLSGPKFPIYVKRALVSKLSKLKVMKIHEIKILGCHLSVLNYLETFFFLIGKLVYTLINTESQLQRSALE